ncbi:MAG TPA: hypothetical protein VE843_10370 [Ktedonobacteraceae bacterium]|nr:hypothetical protein [Ktedonobacteraceae bacterium]
MVANAPSRHPTIVPGEHEGERFIDSLQPWRKRLWVQQILHWTASGIIISMVCVCCLLLLSRFIAWSTVSYWTIGITSGILLCVVGVALWNRPSFARSAHYIDTQLVLQDRISTAWELLEDSTPISILQRRDALQQLGKHSVTATIPLRPGRVRLLVFGVAAMAMAVLILLPNPMNTILEQQATLQARLNRQITAINQTRRIIDNQAAISAQERALIDKILRDAITQLQQSSSQQQAQQSLAQAQSLLNQLRDPQASQKAQGRANASSSLQNSSNANLSNTGKALASGDSKALNTSLQNLSSQIAHMTPAQRSQLAQKIEQAASQGQDNPQLSSALHQLAKAIADGNPSEIADASKTLESASSQDSVNNATNNSINQASQSLQNAANALASSTDSSTSQTANQNQSPGQGQNPGHTVAPGQGQGTSGQNGQNNTNNNSGKNEQVFVPGQVGSGTSNISVDGNTGTVQPGNSVPYSKVIAQYTQMAHDAIQNSNIPPDLKNLVQDYFNSLEGRQ